MQKPKRLRERNSNSLLVAGHGNSMRVENGSLVIKQGFTHYPQKQECHRYFKGDLALPRIIMLLDGSGSLSFDVLSWLAEQSVALARIRSSGDVAIVASGNGFASDQAKIDRSEEHTSELQSLMRISYAVFCLQKKTIKSKYFNRNQ